MQTQEQQKIIDYSLEEIYIDTEKFPAKKIENKFVLIPEGPYSGTIKSYVAEKVPVWQQPGKTETKIITQIEIDEKGVLIPLFLNPYISKSKIPGKSNSKLYNYLTALNALPQDNPPKTVSTLIKYLEDQTIEKKLSVVIKTVNKDIPEKQYSVIKDFFPKV